MKVGDVLSMSAHSSYALPNLADFIPGNSATMEALHRALVGLAPTSIPVLIVGESGTGKDVCALRLHQLSLNSSLPFEKVVCGSTDEDSLRERFQARIKASGADPGGTLFLDGIHELGPALQKHLLALLDSPTSAWNARIVSSTPPGIEREVEAGRFRAELYFRLKGARVCVPPLRERKEDIPVLLEYFLAKHGLGLSGKGLAVGQTELDVFASYDWPGNVRELENLAKKMIAVDSTRIDPKDFPSAIPLRGTALGNAPLSPLKVAARKALRRTERELILDALERTHWNRKKAAQDLQISYKSLLYKIKQIGAEQEENLRGERS
jgi:two-component system, NtrC family, response regulator AtoC